MADAKRVGGGFGVAVLHLQRGATSKCGLAPEPVTNGAPMDSRSTAGLDLTFVTRLKKGNVYSTAGNRRLAGPSLDAAGSTLRGASRGSFRLPALFQQDGVTGSISPFTGAR